MRFEFFLIFLLLASCEKPAPLDHSDGAANGAANGALPLGGESTTLAASQLALAKSHLATGSPSKAIPYHEAAIANGSGARAETLLRKNLSTARFTVPVSRFTHPYPVTTFVQSGEALFAAIAGSHPTVVRWDLTDQPEVTAVLFPAGAESISNLTLSGNYLLIHRGETNLLCLAKTLKPIANLGTFPTHLKPAYLQAFSKNSLLAAHPTADDRTITWRIRDTTTGEILRSESFPLYPKPSYASIEDTALVVSLEDHSHIEIPIIGEWRRIASAMPNTPRPRIVPPPENTLAIIEYDSIIIRKTIPNVWAIFGRPPSFTQALTGYRLNPTTQSLEEIPTPERLEILSKVFPEIPPTFTIHTCEAAVETRLAAAFPNEFPDLTTTARAEAKAVEEAFATDDSEAILPAIRALPPSGLPTATALFLSLKSENPEYIREVLAIAENVPAALLHPEIPLPPNYRNEQDWIGYESPDFAEIFTRHQKETTALVTELTLPENPTEEDVQTFITHLLSPETQAQLPRETLALSAITAARSLSKTQTQATSSLQLTALAQRLGSPQSEILRTNAIALTTLGEFEKAHRAWVSLITEQPEATHEPSDYSEAAHSAFENSDPAQAAEILRTGLFRFPNDVALAIRAGWIALLTDQPEQAADYLTRATRLGLPGDEVENTTALLAIAHTQLGDPDNATGFFKQLTAINPDWADPATIEKLPWPESFKASLRQLAW